MSLKLGIYFTLFTLAFRSVFGGLINLTPDNTKIEFIAIGNPSALKIKGTLKGEEANRIKGGLDFQQGKVSGSAQVDLNAFDTEVELRNKHMKEKYLETEKFPRSQFSFTKLVVDLGASEVVLKQIPFEGELDLHGVKKNISGVVSGEKKNNQLDLLFEFLIKISDFAISVPSFMGITMANDVSLKVMVKGNL